MMDSVVFAFFALFLSFQL